MKPTATTYSIILLVLWILIDHSYCVQAFRPPLLSEELGCSPTLTFLITGKWNDKDNKLVYFDPLGLATDTNFARLREAELKHGRIAMLAVAEKMLLPFASGPVPSNSLPSDYSLSSSILLRLQTLSLSDYVAIIMACGVLEIFVFKQKDPKDMPGDYGTGFFGRRDKGFNEWKLRVELENGRLAMLAIVIQLLLEIGTGGLTWEQQWGLLFQNLSEPQSYLTE